MAPMAAAAHTLPARRQGLLVGLVLAVVAVVAAGWRAGAARPGLVVDAAGAGLVVAGAFVLWGTGVGLVAAGLAVLALRDFGGR